MQQNAYLLAKIGADTAENKRNFGEILAKCCQNYATTLGVLFPWVVHPHRLAADEQRAPVVEDALHDGLVLR